jgi:hypothetical protein
MGNPLAPLMNAQYAGALGGYVTWFLSAGSTALTGRLGALDLLEHECFASVPADRWVGGRTSRLPSEAAGVPSNFAAGQQVMGNPLAPLMNAQ